MQNTTDENVRLSNNFEIPGVSLVLFAVRDAALQVLMRRKKKGPDAGELSLPFGFANAMWDRSLDGSVQRIARQWLEKALPNFRQVMAVGGRNKDHQKKWAITMIYQSLVPAEFIEDEQLELLRLCWVPITSIATQPRMKQHHLDFLRLAMEQGLEHYRLEIEALRFPAGWAPTEFTMLELQRLCQAIMQKRLDPLTFKRRMEAGGIAAPLDGRMRTGGAHRPSQIYSLANEKPRVDQMLSDSLEFETVNTFELIRGMFETGKDAEEIKRFLNEQHNKEVSIEKIKTVIDLSNAESALRALLP